jgi:type I restriction enzyme S subunit
MKRYDSYKDSEIQWSPRVPNHWKVERIKNVFTEKRSTPNSTLNSGSISFGEVIYKDDESIPVSTKESYQELLQGEFLINPLNLNYDLKSLRIGLSRINVVVSQGYIILLNTSENDSEFLRFLLREFDVRHIKSLGNGVRQTISFKHLSNELIPLPPLSEQNQIVSFLDSKTSQIDKLIQKKERKIELLKEYRTSLINQVVTRGLNPNVGMKDSGVEWIGEIPSHWMMRKIKHLFLHSKGRNGQKLTKEYIGENEGDYPVYSGSTKGNGELGRVNEFEFDTGLESVIFVSTVGSDTTVMSTRILSGKFNLSQNCLIMTKKCDLNIQFLHYFTQVDFPYQRSLLPVILKEGHRSVGMGELDEFDVLFPQISEQQQIVEYLDEQTQKIDTSIQTEERKIELLKEYRQSLISSVVTGKIDVRTN